MDMYRVVLTCWDPDVPQPYADDLSGVKLSLFSSLEKAHETISECVEEELICLNWLESDSPREKEPIEDCDGNIIGYDYPFRADEDGDHANIIRFWDGDDYKQVTAYDIYKLTCSDQDLDKCSYFKYRGFWILPNERQNRFSIEQYDTRLATKNTLESALRWVDEFVLPIYQTKSKALMDAMSPKCSLEVVIKNAEAKANVVTPGEEMPIKDNSVNR